MKSNSSNAKKALKWSTLDSIFVKIIYLCVTLILARKLGPELFGLVAMLNVFLAISEVFVNSGFSAALIKK